MQVLSRQLPGISMEGEWGGGGGEYSSFLKLKFVSKPGASQTEFKKQFFFKEFDQTLVTTNSN